MPKWKWLVALFAVLCLVSVAEAQAPNPWPQSGTVTLSGQQVPYMFLTKSPTYIYYTFNLPSTSVGTVMGTIGFPISSARTAAAAQTAIQSRASLYWGRLALPLP